MDIVSPVTFGKEKACLSTVGRAIMGLILGEEMDKGKTIISMSKNIFVVFELWKGPRS